MVKLICRASRLKSDYYQFKRDRTVVDYYDCCVGLQVENMEHMINHSPFLRDIRNEMFEEIRAMENITGFEIMQNNPDIFAMILGNCPDGIPCHVLLRLLRGIAVKVYQMYCVVMRSREGIG